MLPIIAAIQMCSSDDVEENLAVVANLVARAQNSGASVVVLPEMFALMARSIQDKVIIKEKLGAGKIQDTLSGLAKKYHLWIVGGTIPIESTDPDKVFAASIVFNGKGEVVTHYNKIHLFDVSLANHDQYHESLTTEPGSDIIVIDSPCGKLGLSVCYDIRFPELFRALFNQGAEIFTLPAAFTVPTGIAHWQVLSRARAIENFCYLVGAAQGGRHTNGRVTYGHSSIINPWGDIVATLNTDQPGVIFAEIDRAFLNKCRKEIPIHQHQKLVMRSKWN